MNPSLGGASVLSVPMLIVAVMAFAVPTLVVAQVASPVQPATPPPAATSSPPVLTAPPVAPSADIATARAKMRVACGADIAKFCTEAVTVSPPGTNTKKQQRGQIRACLASHTADLSADCKATLAARSAARDAKKP